MHTVEHEVVIAGGGPTGLMLAGELALAGVDVAIVERRANQELDGSRARGLHSHTLDLLDQRGIVERFLSEGKAVQAAGFAWIRLEMSDVPTRYNHSLALLQKHFERILAGWVEELAVKTYRRCELTGFVQDDTRVDIAAAGRSFRAEYLVGCDGGRSLVRKAAGIYFPGFAPTTSHLIAEAEFSGEAEWGLRRDAVGIHGLSQLEDGKTVGILVTEPSLKSSKEPTLSDLSDALRAVYGSDYGVRNPGWISRFTDVTRQAAAYRDRRVFLAGDAAHVHSPVSGQGLGTGVEDAVNLGWKLAQVIKKASPDSLLDTYHAERHPVAARMLRNTRAQLALLASDDRTEALREVLSELLNLAEPRKRLAAMVSGLDVRYELGDGHPLLGRRMPDLELSTSSGATRAHALLHDARPVFLNLGEPGRYDVAAWSDRVRTIDATCPAQWELPVLGPVDAPSATLIRPDGFVAWVGERNEPNGLAEALSVWFGAPTPRYACA